MKIFSISFVVFVILSAFVSCKRKYDLPPLYVPGGAPPITIAQLKAKYAAGATHYKFQSDSSLYCVVTADEVSGNLYKNIYVKDSTGALVISLVNSGGIYVGDSIRINLKGIILDDYSSLIQLDSVDKAKSILKFSSGYNPKPMPMTIAQIIANTAATNTVQSRLIRLDNVEFVSADQNQPYADPIGKASVNRVLKSCDGKTITVRTSGYANFAGNTTPTGNGSFIGLASQYKTTMQLLVRDYTDLTMNGTLCSGTPTTPTGNGTVYITKDFSDNSISSGGWANVNVSGAVSWTTSSAGGVLSAPYAQINNYFSSANHACETWLISPAINLASAVNPVLSFKNAYKFTGDPLKCFVSTDYSSGAPNTATWTELTFTLSSGNYVFVDSGNLSLSNFKNANTRVAFKYTGTSSDGSTWEIDNIVVKEN